MKQKLLIMLAVIITAINSFALDFEVDGIHYATLEGKSSEVEIISKLPQYMGCVDIPASVEYDGLKYNVTSINASAFRGCVDLTSVTIPNSVTSISNSAFSGCRSLTSVTIGNSVTSIGSEAFRNCSSLASVAIPNSVILISDGAFLSCSSLASVTIGNSVTSIGSSAFSNTALYNDRSNWENGVLYIDNYLIQANKNQLVGDYTIKNGTLTVADGAFRDCKKLTSVAIPNSVTSIGTNAFNKCSSLASVTIGNSVTSIGSNAFYDCSSLASVTVGYSVISIGSGAFHNTAIYNDRSNWENGVLYIGNYLIQANAGQLVGDYTIKNGTLTLADWAFNGCIGLTSVTIPNSVISIGGFTFTRCSTLSSVIIPNSVTSISNGAFSGCSGLTSMTIPNSVTSIGDFTFQNCSGLTSVEIPNSVTSIGDSAFWGCNLESVRASWENPAGIEIGTDAFTSVHKITLYVPIGTTENYKYRSPWNNFKEILEYAPGGNEGDEQCAAPVISIADGKLVFTSTTPDAKYYYSIDCDDQHPLTNSDNGIVDLNGTYQISAYAYGEGYDHSDIVTATLVWVNPQIEGAGVISLEAKKAVLIKTIGNSIQICGTEPGESIQLYDINGILIDSIKSCDDVTTIRGDLQSGQIYLIRYGDKSIKYKL